MLILRLTYILNKIVTPDAVAQQRRDVVLFCKTNKQQQKKWFEGLFLLLKQWLLIYLALCGSVMKKMLAAEGEYI